ncbi:MAG: hypothetical protein BMS9Abin11_1748 [Gammaproteobacteria bacterium]|nr:MAG: hypothetical protein BMS9Abin11_1748 [Gammaproteobacteria bacterium]
MWPFKKKEAPRVFIWEPPAADVTYVPAAVYRKYEQLKMAMKAEDVMEVKRLQTQLSISGWKIPYSASECFNCSRQLKRWERSRHGN